MIRAATTSALAQSQLMFRMVSATIMVVPEDRNVAARDTQPGRTEYEGIDCTANTVVTVGAAVAIVLAAI